MLPLWRTGHLAANCSALQHLLRQPTPARLLEGSSEAKVAQVGCMVGPPITGQLTLEGIPALGLVDTGASVTCLGFNVWWCYRAQWGPLRPFEGTVHMANRSKLRVRLNIWTFSGVRLAVGPVLSSLWD